MKATKNNPYKVGDIVCVITGYTMTIVEFYEVVRTTPSKVELKELKQKDNYDGFLSGTTTPCLGEYMNTQDKDGKLFKVREDGVILIPYWTDCKSHDFGRKWDGKPKHFNHCD